MTGRANQEKFERVERRLQSRGREPYLYTTNGNSTPLFFLPARSYLAPMISKEGGVGYIGPGGAVGSAGCERIGRAASSSRVTISYAECRAPHQMSVAARILV